MAIGRSLGKSYHYRVPSLAVHYHSFPHLNVSLHYVNDTFAPDSELYLESLGILSSIPAALLILILFLLLVYLLSRCCDRKPRPKHSIVVLKWTLAIFSVLCSAAICMGLYSNDEFHNGWREFHAAAVTAEQKISGIKNQANLIERSLGDKIPTVLTQLGDVFDSRVQNQTAVKELLAARDAFNQNRNDSLLRARELRAPYGKWVDDLGPYIKLSNLIEDYRWKITVGYLCTQLVFCILLIFGVARHSRCTLVMFSVVALFAVIISWLLSSIYLAIAVATGDFCVNPDLFMEHRAPQLLPSSLHADIVSYYVACDNSMTDPFAPIVRKGTISAMAMNDHLLTMSRIAKNLFRPDAVNLPLDVLTTEVQECSKLMSSFTNLVDCHAMNQQYHRALIAVCDDQLFGLTGMLIATTLAGFFFAILAWLDSHTWIYIRKKRDQVHSSNGSGIRGGGGHNNNGHSGGVHAISNQRLGSGGGHHHVDNGQYATLNRKFRTLEHPVRQRPVVSFESATAVVGGAGASHTLGHHGKKYGPGGGGGGQYSTLNKKCKTLEANDFY